MESVVKSRGDRDELRLSARSLPHSGTKEIRDSSYGYENRKLLPSSRRRPLRRAAFARPLPLHRPRALSNEKARQNDDAQNLTRIRSTLPSVYHEHVSTRQGEFGSTETDTDPERRRRARRRRRALLRTRRRAPRPRPTALIRSRGRGGGRYAREKGAVFKNLSPTRNRSGSKGGSPRGLSLFRSH